MCAYICQHNFLTCCNLLEPVAGRVSTGPVPHRGLPVPEFGAWLREQREASPHLSQEAVVRRVAKQNAALVRFTRGQLAKYEKGSVAAPDPAVLYYLARLYRISTDELLRRLAESRALHAVPDEEV